MRANPTAQLKGFAEHYEKCIQNTVHYERLMPETDQDKRLNSFLKNNSFTYCFFFLY